MRTAEEDASPATLGLDVDANAIVAGFSASSTGVVMMYWEIVERRRGCCCCCCAMDSDDVIWTTEGTFRRVSSLSSRRHVRLRGRIWSSESSRDILRCVDALVLAIGEAAAAAFADSRMTP